MDGWMDEWMDELHIYELMYLCLLETYLYLSTAPDDTIWKFQGIN